MATLSTSFELPLRSFVLKLALDVEGTVALVGPSGAGKTSVLKAVAGLTRPPSGRIALDADVWLDSSAGLFRSPDERRVGLVFQEYALFPHMNVRQNVAYAGKTRADEYLERFRISHLAEAMGTELSSGQRTLIGIVRSTLHRPRLLVLDEPTASLDPDVALRVREGLIEVAATEGTALLMTSHDMTDVEQVCERVLFLSAGHIVADGTPDSIAAAYGRGNLEGVFLHLAGDREASHSQQSDHP